jgi:hypothetical protein
VSFAIALGLMLYFTFIKKAPRYESASYKAVAEENDGKNEENDKKEINENGNVN